MEGVRSETSTGGTSTDCACPLAQAANNADHTVQQVAGRMTDPALEVLAVARPPNSLREFMIPIAKPHEEKWKHR
jgi:hypothetical protein